MVCVLRVIFSKTIVLLRKIEWAIFYYWFMVCESWDRTDGYLYSILKVEIYGKKWGKYIKFSVLTKSQNGLCITCVFFQDHNVIEKNRTSDFLLLVYGVRIMGSYRRIFIFNIETWNLWKKMGQIHKVQRLN